MPVERGSTTLALDTSVLIAALLAWHERHADARAAVEHALAKGRVVVPDRVLVEAYSVMTRLPSPQRVAPADACALLEGLRRQVDIVRMPDAEL